VVGLALMGTSLACAGLAVTAATGVLAFADSVRGPVAGAFGAVAAVDFLLGFWFFRSSLSS
jgi:hypothetical protein